MERYAAAAAFSLLCGDFPAAAAANVSTMDRTAAPHASATSWSLGFEVPVEPAVSESGRGHQVGETGVAYAIAAKLGGGCADNELPGFGRLLLRPSHVDCNRSAGGSIVIVVMGALGSRGRQNTPHKFLADFKADPM